MAIPAIAPESRGPVNPDGVNVAVGVGSVTLTTSVEKMLPCRGSVAGGSSFNLQAPSRIDMTVRG